MFKWLMVDGDLNHLSWSIIWRPSWDHLKDIRCLDCGLQGLAECGDIRTDTLADHRNLASFPSPLCGQCGNMVSNDTIGRRHILTNKASLQVLMAQSNRWKSVEFMDFDDHINKALATRAGLFQALETLRLETVEGAHNIYAFQIAPCLKEIILHSWAVSSLGERGVPWEQLTTLDLSTVPDDHCHGTLLLCPNLEECWIWYPLERLESTTSYYCPSTIDLAVDDDFDFLPHFLSELSLAQLQHLEMSGVYRWPHRTVTQQSSNTLSLLPLRYCDITSHEMLELLQSLPFLCRLALYVEERGKGLFRDVIIGLTPAQGDAMLIPRLSSFDFSLSAIRLSNELANNFTTMVKLRWSHKSTNSHETSQTTCLNSSKFETYGAGFDENAYHQLRELRDEGYDIELDIQ